MEGERCGFVVVGGKVCIGEMLAVVVLDDQGLERYNSDECTGKRNFLGEAVEGLESYMWLCAVGGIFIVRGFLTDSCR
jgi:hypothetical protein